LVNDLVGVTEYSRADFTGHRQQTEVLVPIVEADLVQPSTADRQRWMMQANQNVLGGGVLQFLFEPGHFRGTDSTTSLAIKAAIYAQYLPIAE
jgi:hypothetical protein